MPLRTAAYNLSIALFFEMSSNNFFIITLVSCAKNILSHNNVNSLKNIIIVYFILEGKILLITDCF